MAIFTKCEIHPNCFGDFCLLLSEPNAFESSGVSQVLGKLIEASHATSWMSCDGLDSFVLSTQGSKPGDPLGDIIFTFLIVKVLRKIKQAARREGISCTLHLPASSTVFGNFEQASEELDAINYVDDCAFPICAPTHDQVLENLCMFTALAVDVFASFLMQCDSLRRRRHFLFGTVRKRN